MYPPVDYRMWAAMNRRRKEKPPSRMEDLHGITPRNHSRCRQNVLVSGGTNTPRTASPYAHVPGLHRSLHPVLAGIPVGRLFRLSASLIAPVTGLDGLDQS